MQDFIRRYGHFLLMLLIWLAVGVVAGQAVLVLVPISIYLLKRKDMYLEMIMGLFFLIVLSDSQQYFLSFAKNAKILYTGLMFALIVLNRKSFSKRSTIFYPFIPFLLLSLCLIVVSPIKPQSIPKIIAYCIMFFTIPNYVLKIFQEKGEGAFKDLAYFFAFILFIGNLLIPIFPNVVFIAGRYSGIFGNPNGVGLFCTVFFLFLSLVIHRNPKSFNRNDLIILYGAIFISLILSVSRSSIFSILLFIIFLRFYRVSYWYGFVALIASILLYQVLSDNIVVIIQSLGLDQYLRVHTLKSGSGRLIAWAFAWKHIQYHFYFGQGFGFADYILGINTLKLQALGHVGGVHNTYLSLWLNTGLVGLILFLIGFFRTFFTASSKSYFALPIMFAIMFSIMFESWLIATLNPYTIVFLIIITLLHLDSKTAASLHESNIVPRKNSKFHEN